MFRAGFYFRFKPLRIHKMADDRDFLWICAFGKKRVFCFIRQGNDMIQFLPRPRFKRFPPTNAFVVVRDIFQDGRNNFFYVPPFFRIETLLRVVKVRFRSMHEIEPF